ncbi:MAG: MBOAT family O-acyltransferase [Alphaproteobacteria bacterium]
MISFTFAAATLVLALATTFVAAALRPGVVAALSLAGLALVWPIPTAALLAGSVGTWMLGRLLPRLEERSRSLALGAAILAVIAALVLLRAPRASRDTLVPQASWIGLSYFALKFVQHLLDAAAGRVASVDLASFLATILFLPTFAAGPIERTGEFATKLAREPLPWAERVLGLERVVVGLGKKLLVGDRLLAFAEPVFADPAGATRGSLWLAMYAFAIALWLDFSGYSDIAIGAGRIAGFTIRENFDSPYLQPDLARLWQHWHMSLTSWLRDFVFVPVARRTLRATKKPLLSQGVAQTATMVACGLWHGFAWNFVAWGLWHAALLTGLAARRAAAGPRRAASPADSRRDHVLGAIASFHAFAFGLLLFGCSVRGALRYGLRMFGLDALLPS